MSCARVLPRLLAYSKEYAILSISNAIHPIGQGGGGGGDEDFQEVLMKTLVE